jgi:hypothetical protein
MVIRKTELPYAAVRRLCIVEEGITVEKQAVDYAIVEAQQFVIKMMKSAAVAMKHRNGSMIMLKDVLSVVQIECAGQEIKE